MLVTAETEPERYCPDMGETEANLSREAIRAAIEARRFSPAMKRALGRVLEGESYRAAAAGEGVGWRELHRNAATVPGLKAAHLEAWRESWGRAFPAVWRRHVANLTEAGLALPPDRRE